MTIGAGLFAALVAGGFVFDRSTTHASRLTQYQKNVPDIDREWFLASDSRHYDSDAFYNGWWGVGAGVRAADVVFMGNSRSVYGLRQLFLQPYFDRVGLKTFSLDFPGDGTAKQLTAILTRAHARPRLLIINSEPEMFGTEWGVNMQAAASRSRWQSLVHFHEAQAAWTLRKRLHRVVPPLLTYALERPDPVTYRSNRTGAVRWFGDVESNVPFAATDTPDLEAAARLFDTERPAMDAFLRERRAQGTSVVLTLVPYPRYRYHALPLTELRAKHFDIPFVPIDMDGLSGRDETHLDTRSARIVAERFTTGLMTVPLFRELVPAPLRAGLQKP